MRCLFCKNSTINSKSVEHIIPESLGNQNQILPKGVVCDKCNNFFAINIEKPFLELKAISLLRFNEGIPNKRNKIPSTKGILFPNYPVTLNKSIKDDELMATVDVPPEAFEKILTQGKGTITFLKEAPLPNGTVVSRFLGKIALEAMAQRLVDHPEGLDYLVHEHQLDPLRDHVRRGKIKDWPVHIRRIYDADKKWRVSENSFQVIYEYDILATENQEYFFVLAIFGLEFSINYGEPSVDGYIEWLEKNNNCSPLYIGKNKTSFSEE